MACGSPHDMFSASPFWHNGPVPGGLHDFPGSKTVPLYSGAQRFHTPVTTGTSVLAIKCDGGVVIAADILGSYGSLARFRDLNRVHKINANTVLGVSGDYADFQHLQQIIEQKVISEQCLDDGFALKPRSLLCWLTRHLYYRRSRYDPLWTNFIVGGIQDGQPFLGTVDKLGTAYEDDHIATGYGAYIALPVMRDELARAKQTGKPITKEEACKVLERCMTVLFFRDARSFPKYEMITLTEEGYEHHGTKTVNANWEIAHMVKGY